MKLFRIKVSRDSHHPCVLIHIQILHTVHIIDISASNSHVIFATIRSDCTNSPTSIGGLLIPTKHSAIKGGRGLSQLNLPSGHNLLASTRRFIDGSAALLNGGAQRPSQILQLKGSIIQRHIQSRIAKPTTKQRIGLAATNLIGRSTKAEGVLGQNSALTDKIITLKDKSMTYIRKESFSHVFIPP